MFYTTEEAAIVCGFLNLYLDRASVDVSVRRRNAAFQLGAATETLQPEDYRWAENVLCFLKPCWWQLHEDYYRGFANYLKAHGINAFVPDSPYTEHIYIPHIYTKEEISKLFYTCDSLIPR